MAIRKTTILVGILNSVSGFFQQVDSSGGFDWIKDQVRQTHLDQNKSVYSIP